MIPIDGGIVPTSGISSFMYYRGLQKGTPHYHRGVDIAAPKGKPVKAAESGIVTHAVTSYTPSFSGYGKTVVIKSDRGIHYLYGHMTDVYVDIGQKVKTGEIIGSVGYTAFTDSNPTGDLENRAPHLHFETSNTKYPKPREAARLDPVEQLKLTPGQVAVAAGGGILFLFAAIGAGIWYLTKKRKNK